MLFSHHYLYLPEKVVALVSEGEGPAQSRTAQATLEAAIDTHDTATQNVALWMGAEPTFTDRSSEASEWLSEALGHDKAERARRLITRLRDQFPGAVVLRPVGRQYSGEPEPRFCYGLYARRDGSALWSGPADLLCDGAPSVVELGALTGLRDTLCACLRAAGWFAAACDPPDAQTRRLLCRADGANAVADPGQDPRLARSSVHGCKIEGAGLEDPLASEGSYLVLLHQGAGGPAHNAFWIELPAFARVSELTTFLRALADACRALAVPSLGLRGFAPPIDESVAWTTITPDPAVLEINQAPQPTLRDFCRAERRIAELAAEVDLAPYRLHYNGELTDSGGGGQLTFGGPSPERSPFFTCPVLLPRLIRYVIRHPALSYWFATRYVGASSQSPRADEGVREAFLELGVALEQLALLEAPLPNTLWATLRHFLADASGNPHRSELNIEKLDNPFLPGRGRLGLVEFRAFAMAPSFEQSIARAQLLRAIMVMLMRHDRAPELIDWGDTLHDRFALPFFLRRDLQAVFADLSDVGLGLGARSEALLLEREHAWVQRVELPSGYLSIEQGVEFWPLVGDVASQEGGSSRLVDASSARLQLMLEAESAGDAALSDIELSVRGFRIPMRAETSSRGAALRVLGLRYRSFVPWTGIHPTMPAESHIEITVRNRSGFGLRVALYSWRPDGASYPGLPRDREEAAARRAERVVVERVDAAQLPIAREPPPRAVSPHCLDLRRLPRV